MINSKWLSQDFYEQMEIDEILMREHEPIEINWISIVAWTENNETRLNVLFPNVENAI